MKTDLPKTGLLCLANFPANTGYAWDFIESLYAGVGNRLEPRGIKTWIVKDRLVRAPWPGNVRELRNVIEHAVVLVDHDGPIETEDLAFVGVGARVDEISPSGFSPAVMSLDYHRARTNTGGVRSGAPEPHCPCVQRQHFRRGRGRGRRPHDLVSVDGEAWNSERRHRPSDLWLGTTRRLGDRSRRCCHTAPIRWPIEPPHSVGYQRVT
jgi:hypothetical protein